MFFNDLKAIVAPGDWTAQKIKTTAPDEHAAGEVPLTVTIKDGSKVESNILLTVGMFTEKPKPIAKMDKSNGPA
ncbi:MAG: hypothetical protein ABR991_04795, partial [Terracidiphilus sp.]